MARIRPSAGLSTATASATYVPSPSATTPASPVAGQVWKSSRYQDVRVSNSPADRRKILTGALSFEGNVVQEPSVYIAGGNYNILYTGGTGTPVLCYASCPLTADPTVAANWTKNSTKVLGGGVGGQAGGLYHGNAYVEGSTIYYYYVDQATNATIRLATAPLTGSAPVFTDQGVVMTLPYTAVGFGNTYLLKISSTYYLIFEMSIANWQLGVATSTSPSGTFTAIQTTMNTLWPGSGNWTASGPWATVENGLVVLYYHSGPAVSGSLPTEIYRATVPVGSFGTDAWTIGNNKKPILRRVAAEEVDQVADAYVVTNAAGQSYVLWEGYDNSTSKASIFCQPLLPVERVYDGSVWQTVTPAADTGQSITSPGKPAAATLTTDYSNATTSFTTALSVKFTPTGTKAVVTLVGTGSNSTNVANLFNINQGATNVPLGSITAPTGGYQFAFGGIAIFTGLTPGVTYTFNAQAKVASGTFSCRPAAFPANEQMSLKAEDLAYPSASSI